MTQFKWFDVDLVPKCDYDLNMKKQNIQSSAVVWRVSHDIFSGPPKCEEKTRKKRMNNDKRKNRRTRIKRQNEMDKNQWKGKTNSIKFNRNRGESQKSPKFIDFTFLFIYSKRETERKNDMNNCSDRDFVISFLLIHSKLIYILWLIFKF